MSNHWTGTGIWQGWCITTDHSASSYNQPVLVDPAGQAYGPGDIINRDLIGLREAAAMLGWDPRRVTTYRQRGSFPEPIQQLAAGPVWLKSQIEEFITNRTRGRWAERFYEGGEIRQAGASAAHRDSDAPAWVYQPQGRA